MKRIITALALMLTITLNADGIDQVMSEAQQDDIIKASSYCFTKHPVLIPQAKTVMKYALGIAFNTSNLDINTFETAVAEISAFRKNVLKLCGHYNGNTIKDAFAITGLNLEATYELIGTIAGVGMLHD